MRIDSLRRLIAGGALVIALAVVTREDRAAADDPIPVRIIIPSALVAGSVATVFVEVDVEADARRALLLTPTSEGSAIEFVRGRLMLADAEREDAAPLRFQVPLVARAPGTGVIRAAISTYRCGPRGCRRVEGAASLVVRVTAP